MSDRQLRAHVRIRRTEVQDRLYLKYVVPVEQVFLLLVGTRPQNVLQQAEVSSCHASMVSKSSMR